MGQAVLLDAQIIKTGFIWSLITFVTAVVLMCLYYTCLGTEIDVVRMTFMLIEMLFGAMTNALLTLVEYHDQCDALKKHEEARALLA